MDQTSNDSDKISYFDDPNYFTTVSLPRPPKKKGMHIKIGQVEMI